MRKVFLAIVAATLAAGTVIKGQGQPSPAPAAKPTCEANLTATQCLQLMTLVVENEQLRAALAAKTAPAPAAGAAKPAVVAMRPCTAAEAAAQKAQDGVTDSAGGGIEVLVEHLPFAPKRPPKGYQTEKPCLRPVDNATAAPANPPKQ